MRSRYFFSKIQYIIIPGIRIDTGEYPDSLYFYTWDPARHRRVSGFIIFSYLGSGPTQESIRLHCTFIPGIQPDTGEYPDSLYFHTWDPARHRRVSGYIVFSYLGSGPTTESIRIHCIFISGIRLNTVNNQNIGV